MNKVVLVGRLAKDVDYRQNGDSTIAKFSIAVDRKFKDKNGEYGCDFIGIIAFGKTADFISQYFHKGMRIGIVGRIQTGSYVNKNNQKVYTTDVVCEEAEFVESKGNSQQNERPVQHNTQPQEDPANDGFVNITDDIPELPFN